MMDTLLKLEEGAMFGLGILVFSFFDFAWWVFPLCLLLPDLSMAGYVVDNRWGAVIYNIFHHKGFAVVIFVLGLSVNEPLVQLTGVILFSHICMDRIFGYGLKYSDSFKHSHLGWIGNKDKTD